MPNVSNFDELYPGRFLKAGLFKGAKPTMTIKDVVLEELEGNNGKKQKKGVISFVERDMELCLNKTNGLCLKAMFGKEINNWLGKKVTLFSSQYDGEECIRVWGSPDIEKDEEITIELARKKPFKMRMHAVKAAANGKKPPMTAPDPRILTAWEVLGWKREKGDEDRASKAAEMDDARYLAYLNSLIDNDTADVFGGTLVP